MASAEDVSASILYLCSYVIPPHLDDAGRVDGDHGCGFAERFSAAVHSGRRGQHRHHCWIPDATRRSLGVGRRVPLVALPLGSPPVARARLIGLAATLALAPLTALTDTSVMHMQVGQCNLLRREDRDHGRDDNCTSEHDAEVFYMTSVDGGDFPSEAALQQRGRGMHFQLQKGLRGVALRNLDAGCDVDAPTKDSWAQNDQFRSCLPRKAAGSFQAHQVREGFGPVSLLVLLTLNGCC